MRLDLRADLHGHAADYVSDVDRAWFAAHPGVDVYVRQGLPHEWCCPVCAAEGGGCVPVVVDIEGVVIMRLGPGLRARQYVGGRAGPCRHVDEMAELPPAWARRIFGGQP